MSEAINLTTLNKTQLDILKLFSRELEEKELVEIKKMIVEFLSKKVTTLADEVWVEKNWSDEQMENFLISEERTPYKAQN